MQQFIWFKDTMQARGFTDHCFVERPEYTEGYPVYSRSFFCPVCRKIWGEVSTAHPTDDPHRPEMASCSFCNWHDSVDRTIPGSILNYSITSSGVDFGLLDVLPEPLLRREFELTLKAIGG